MPHTTDELETIVADLRRQNSHLAGELDAVRGTLMAVMAALDGEISGAATRLLSLLESVRIMAPDIPLPHDPVRAKSSTHVRSLLRALRSRPCEPTALAISVPPAMSN